LNKFLCFGEDIRPLYYGTWSKSSKFVTARRPFGKDTKHFDYEYDSEAEWEEGNNDMGEDLGVEDNEEEEKDEEGEGEDVEEEDDGGWLAADDDDDADEETKRLRKKMRVDRTNNTTMVLIAPRAGGKPFLSESNANQQDEPNPGRLTEGINAEEATKLLLGHGVITVQDYGDQFDAFPPSLMDETPAEEGNSPSKELSGDDKAAFLKNVHNSTLASKDKLVDQLRTEIPSLSRTLVLKTLETVAEKQKHPVRGFIWIVKKDVLESAGLVHLADSDSQESAKQDYLRRMARQIHHSKATSKEKLADELMARLGLREVVIEWLLV
jgi:hypothetical protein